MLKNDLSKSPEINAKSLQKLRANVQVGHYFSKAMMACSIVSHAKSFNSRQQREQYK